MPLYEIETTAHIIITWAADEDAATQVVREAYPADEVIRLTKRPRDTWVISKAALGIAAKSIPVRWHAIACRKPRETRSTRSVSTCRKPGRICLPRGR